MAKARARESSDSGLDPLRSTEFAQQVLHDFGLAIELLAVACLELHPQHPGQSNAEHDQEKRGGGRKQHDQPRRQRQARRPRDGHLLQARSSST
jgi:hypothetical protein